MGVIISGVEKGLLFEWSMIEVGVKPPRDRRRERKSEMRECKKEQAEEERAMDTESMCIEVRMCNCAALQIILPE